MNHVPGAGRSSVPPIFPSALRSLDLQKIIYLDLNHWIELSKARKGHSNGLKHKAVFDVLANRVLRNEVLLPLTDTLYIELSGIGSYQQRVDLRETMDVLCRNRSIAGRPTIARVEVEAMLDAFVGPRNESLDSEPVDYVGRGVGHAFGFNVEGKIESMLPGDTDMAERIRASTKEWLERKMIDGPDANEEHGMRASGWDPQKAIQVAERRADEELDLVRMLDEQRGARKGRLRDIVSARELAWSIPHYLSDGLAARGVKMEDAVGEKEHVRELVDAMPSFDVSVSLKTEYHRNGQHRWTRNDIFDINALSTTIPYCSVVLADKAACATAKRCGLPDRYETHVGSTLSELEDLL